MPTLVQNAANELQRLPLGTAPQTLRAIAPGFDVQCELIALDTLACAFLGLNVATDTLANATPQTLKDKADRLAARLTYLLEPISPVELDADRCTMQLRSNPPQRHEGRSSYYELLLRRGGEISLVRYEAAPGQSRQAVPAQVTREVLLRLIGDFATV